MLSLDEIVARLKEIVGPRLVSTNPIDKINYQHTLAYGAYRALPDVIVRIESNAAGHHKVAEILKFANEHKIPIVAKGGVGMGISSPLKGGVLLDIDSDAQRTEFDRHGVGHGLQSRFGGGVRSHLG